MISQEEFITRQKRLLHQCQPNSIVVIRGASEVVRSRDTDYPFRQDSDFFYLTNFTEPDSWLILSNRGDGDDPVFRAMAVRPSDPKQEIWHGRRLGVEEAEQHFMLDMCCAVDDIEEALLALVDEHEHLYWSLGHSDEADSVLGDILSQLKASRNAQAPATVVDWQPLLHEMRLFKSCSEIAVMKQAAALSCDAHRRAMTFAAPSCTEYQLAAEIHHTFAMGGASAPAYNTIVGAGVNGCILHYTENQSVVQDGDLVLIDAGAEYLGYAADITRTFPVNGRFTDAQRAVYQVVLDAQLAALDVLEPECTLSEANAVATQVLTQGLIGLGLLSGERDALIAEEAHRRFYMHGLGHWLGLDVHDVGDYKEDGEDRPLMPGMTMTVEPGLYIPDEPDIPEAYRGIGIRIEDNIVITAKGHEVLTAQVPKTIADIEALMQEAKA